MPSVRGNATGEHELRRVRQLIVHAGIELRLRGAGVGVRRIQPVERVRDGACRPWRRVLGEITSRQFVGLFVVDGLGVSAVHIEERAGAVVHAGRIAIEIAGPNCYRSTARRQLFDAGHGEQQIAPMLVAGEF
jgi:hypothetical protein